MLFPFSAELNILLYLSSDPSNILSNKPNLFNIILWSAKYPVFCKLNKSGTADSIRKLYKPNCYNISPTASAT